MINTIGECLLYGVALATPGPDGFIEHFTDKAQHRVGSEGLLKEDCASGREPLWMRALLVCQTYDHLRVWGSEQLAQWRLIFHKQQGLITTSEASWGARAPRSKRPARR